MTLARFVRKRLRPRLLAVYALGALLLLAARPGPGSLLLGAIPVVAGEALRFWATGFLHKNDALTTAGPYAYLRHPLYLGTLLIGTGFAIMASHPVGWSAYALFVVVFFGYYLPYKDRIESARLESLYGDAYRRYAAAVPRLLPRFTAYRPLPADRPEVESWETVRFADNNERGMVLAVGSGVLAMVLRWALL
jgi:protein-S-isoprenylcysteine O-methyltransferase Ste14